MMESIPTAPKVHCVSLACRAIHEHFGKLPAVVAEVLLCKGRQTFAELLRNINSDTRSSRQLHVNSLSHSSSSQQPSTMTSGQLKQVLMVLIQQNCVITHLQPSEVLVTGVKPAVYIYEADAAQMLQLIRRPKIAQHIRDETAASPEPDETGTLIVEVLLEHGRLRFDQILQAVVSRMPQDAAKIKTQEDASQAHSQSDHQESASSNPSISARDSPSQMVSWAFLQLLQERYIERAPPCNLPPLRPKTAAPARAKKSAPKPGTAEYAEAQVRAQQQQQHHDYQEIRFKMPSELTPAAVKAEADGPADAAEVDLNDAAADAAAARAAAAAAASHQPRKRKKTAGGITADDAAAAAAAEAAAAAADTAAAVRQAAAMSRKRRKTNIGKAAADELTPTNRVPVKLETAEDLNTAAAAAAGGKGPRSGLRKAAVQEVEPPTGHEVLWRVNTEEFNRRFRNKAMATLVSDRLGQDAGTVLAAMLMHAGRFEEALNDVSSKPMAVGEVATALRAAQDSGRLPPLRDDTTVQDQIKALSWDSLDCVEVGPPGPLGDTYVVNLANIIDKIKLQELNRVLMDKFGLLGLRVFNTLLLHGGQLEPKQIADFIMREHKEARELLYRMFKAGYLQMQDIPKSADRAPSRCFYTFKADWCSTCAKLTADMIKAADNLHARLTHELSRHVELLELVEAAQAAGHLVFNMTATQRRSLEQLRKVTNALQLSLLQLDGMLALFNEYS